MASPATTILTGERLRAYSAAADKALAQVKSILEAKQKELDEYSSLIHRLEEMPKKRSEAVMCPIGSVGFLPATIVHTNEILVGLGDGYFADVSAYQAVEILRRRITVLENNITDLHKHESIITQQITFAKEIYNHQSNPDEIEIREEYDEEKEAELKKKRRSRVPAKPTITKTMADVNAEAAMMKRLEELEQQELQNGELDDDTNDMDENELSDIPETIIKELEDAKGAVPIQVGSQPDKSSVPLKPASIASTSKPTESSNARSSELDVDSVERSREEKPLSDPQVIDRTVVEDGLSVGVFRGEDLIKALTEQDQVYDENGQICEPPRGVDPKDFQKLLEKVAEMNSDDSCSDHISEEDGADGEVEAGDGVEKEAERSELDSDDLSQPETDYAEPDCNSVKIGKFVVQNLGPSAVAPTTRPLGTQKQPKPMETRSCEPATSSQLVIKSILSNAEEKSPINEDEIRETNEPSKVVLPGSTEAFSGVVKERSVEVLTTSSDVPAAITQPSSSKPQSLFKMKRLQKNL
ncbi:Prefoldin alpha subunit [Trichostrongylus colubriformis]|uniref:Prefoldin alpha subunit n=1 Tax=Trichostrongylus colubriformis TaxID=6319 RepID=A0AAN8FVR3_TRICO